MSPVYTFPRGGLRGVTIAEEPPDPSLRLCLAMGGMVKPANGKHAPLGELRPILVLSGLAMDACGSPRPGGFVSYRGQSVY